MEALKFSSVSSLSVPKSPHKTQFSVPRFLKFQLTPIPTSHFTSKSSKIFSISSSSSFSSENVYQTESQLEKETQEEKFDWFSQWYPVMPVCDLDKRVPLAKKILGLDVVVWWDRNENQWRVFADACPHRLAPLSEGRIDKWGRLQCVYHGWCFNGSGHCKFIPQAHPDGPPVHTSKKACAAVYPSSLQNEIVWFWPNTDPQYKDMIKTKTPPNMPVFDDPSYTKLLGNRDFPYGYEVLLENLMDPSHIPYAHFGLIPNRQPKGKADIEGGRPLELNIKKLDINGFNGMQECSSVKFIAPCIFYTHSDPVVDQAQESASSAGPTKKLEQRRKALIFICIPVSPGNSRLIWSIPTNLAIWIDKIFPRWIFHIRLNLILDSDLYLLHIEERKIRDVGPTDWQKACFLPTKADTFVIGYRRWLNKYAGGQVDWRGKFSGALPPMPPREQLMDRYWSHVVNCSSCSAAHKTFTALEVILQLVSVVSIGIAATKQNTMPAAARTAVVLFAVVCIAVSKWLAYFTHKVFHFHDYNHARVLCRD